MSAPADTTVVLTRLDTVTPERVRWLWPGRVACGKLNIWDGDPGQGKTTCAIDLGARTTTGRAMPDGAACGAPGGFIILTGEDGIADTIVPRLRAAGAALARCATLALLDGDGERPLSLPGDLEALEAAITNLGATLVVIDPFMAFLDGSVNARQDQDVRRALARLAAVAERTGAAIVLIRHLNKMAGTNPLYRGGGSIGLIGAARVGLLVAPDPDTEGRSILAVSKCNLAPPAPALAYRLEDAGDGAARVVWEGVTSHTATSLLAQSDNDEERHELTDAESFLLDALREGPRAARDVLSEGRQAGIGERTLKRAKASLRVDSRKHGQGGWTWELPSKDAKDANNAKDVGDRPLGTLPDSKDATVPITGTLGPLGILGTLPANGHVACRLCGAPAVYANPTGRHCRQHALAEPGGLTELLAGAERDTPILARPGAGEGSAR